MSKIIKNSNVKTDGKIFSVDIPHEDFFTGESDLSDNTKTYGDSVFNEFEDLELLDDMGEGGSSNDMLEEISLSSEDIIENANNEAARLVENAKKEAEEIIETAREKAISLAEEIKKEAEEKGYNDGLQKGEIEAKSLIDQANETLLSAKAEKQQILNSAEPQIIDLVQDLLNKLIGETVKINNDIILHLIRKGLSTANASGKLSIHISVEDYDNVINNKHLIETYVDSDKELEFVKDVLLGKNECIIETPFGNVDSSLDSQLESLKQDLLYMTAGETGTAY